MGEDWVDEWSAEARSWYERLRPGDQSRVDRVVGVLKERGNLAKMPLSRTLGHGLFELRFTLDRRQMRITYTFKPGKRILLLTTFAKTRDNEQREVRRAREALEALAEGKW